MGAFGSSSLFTYLTFACLFCGPAQHTLVCSSPDLGQVQRSAASSVLRCAGNALASSCGMYGAQLIRGKVLVNDGRTLTGRFVECQTGAVNARLARLGKEDLPPVVLVPGAGGNQLEIKLTDKYKAGSFWCRFYNRSDYFRVWLDVLSLVPPFTSCFAERMQLLYDPASDTFRNNDGVEARVPYFSSTQGLQYLDPTFKSVSIYMQSLVAALENEGYVDGQSLFGAPYDFRYALGPNTSEVARTYHRDLKNLIESAYSSNANRKVVLVAHSLGGLWILCFLNQQSEAWLHNFISHFVSVATPWGGTVEQMKTYASGNNQGVKILDPLYFRDEQRSSESNLWLLPVPRVFGAATLVVTPNRNYTAYDMEDFFRDIAYPEAVVAYRSRFASLGNKLPAPVVPVTIMYSRGVETVETFVYNSDSFDSFSDVVIGDGDGTVNFRSLTATIKDWQEAQNQSVRVVELPSSTHSGCLTDSQAVQTIVGEILHERVPVQL
eukprot:TRINITY_DN3658_c0_g1_i1.p1 TRINITY_DN3658_c0_g1~~TRINITY_DN3658_c0_g1_i1.p1  ORF type:complete len:493 (-),score=41.54 TRINITY_DN3658_c0_g1_i1:85-1563(-)